ncbi:DUF5803 family protein [Halovivax limisalsi]|uniref:DUF5803 family protein n=1 Tax=Halovivax limisalsi TaxID=1453760 RepID=UPI001FFC95BE|nr:DUF5803 family protein [Halovivax limisalsi]
MPSGSRRLVLATAAVLCLLALSGCSGLFGGISDEQLDREGSYDDLRERNATVAIDVEDGGLLDEGSFRAVYTLNGTDELELYTSSFFSTQPLDVSAVRFWYENGTMVTGSELDVEQDRSSTDISLPASNGTLAFTANTDGSSFSLPAYVEGSYDVTLPEDHRTSMYLFGSVSPSGYDRTVEDDRERLVWDEVDGSISISYYQERDVPIFVGIVLVVLSAGAVALTYTYLKLRRLQRTREAIDGSLDATDDGGSPPWRR